MITKTLIIVGAIIAVLIIILLTIIIVKYLKYYCLELKIKKGTHILFKVDDKQYNLYNKGNIIIDKDDNVSVVINKSIDDKNHFYLYCKIIKD
jgi:hypothetical protein